MKKEAKQGDYKWKVAMGMMDRLRGREVGAWPRYWSNMHSRSKWMQPNSTEPHANDGHYLMCQIHNSLRFFFFSPLSLYSVWLIAPSPPFWQSGCWSELKPILCRACPTCNSKSRSACKQSHTVLDNRLVHLPHVFSHVQINKQRFFQISLKAHWTSCNYSKTHHRSTTQGGRN